MTQNPTGQGALCTTETSPITRFIFRPRSGKNRRLAHGSAPLAVLLFVLFPQATFSSPRELNLFLHRNPSGEIALSTAKQGPWTVIRPGDQFEKHRVLCVSSEPDEPWAVLETEDDTSGQIRYVGPGGNATRISKVFGKLGRQPVPKVIQRTDAYWKRLLEAENDVLAAEYLADPRDPSYARTANLLAPLLFPDAFVGMREYPHEVHVAWDGSIGIDPGFFTGREWNTREFASALPFALNGKEISPSESLSLLRGQLESYLPVTQYVYQRPTEQVGWEQIVLMGKVDGKAGLFLRFRLANHSQETKLVTFSVQPPFGGRIDVKEDHLLVTAPFPKPGPMPDDPQAAREKQRQIDQKEFSVPLCANEPFVRENNLPVWKFQLAGGRTKDLHLFLPGHSPSGPLRLNPQQIQPAFYQALKSEYDSWQAFFRRGVQVQIPEPEVTEIFRGALAKVLVCVDKDEVRGGAVHYEGFWPFCALSVVRLMLDLGYHDEARRYLDRFLKTRIEPSGRFRFNERADRFQMFDTGDFLTTLAKYYWYTGDAHLIEENQEAIDRVLRFIYETRSRSADQYPPTDPRHGLIEGILNNDVKEVTYYYTTDAPIWAGLRNYSQALRRIGTDRAKPELLKQADEMADYARQYHRQLRRSFQTALERDDNGISFIHIHPVLGEIARPDICKFRTNTFFRAHRRFHEWPRFVGTGFLEDEEIRAIFDYEAHHEQTVLGVRRYLPHVLDNFQINAAAFQKLRLGMVREFLMEYYAYLHYMLAPGTWSGFEQVQVVPKPGDNGRYSGPRGKLMPACRLSGWEGAHATWPVATLTKQIFAFDEPGGGAIWLARGIPRHWLRGGETVGASGIPTRYGKLDLSMRYDAEGRTLHVDITPQQDRTIPEIRLGARGPKGGSPASARCISPKAKPAQLLPDQELVIVRDVKGPLSLQVRFQ